MLSCFQVVLRSTLKRKEMCTQLLPTDSWNHQKLMLLKDHRRSILLNTKTAPKGNAVKSGERIPNRATGREWAIGLWG